VENKAVTIERVQELLETYESAGLSDVTTKFLRNVIEEKQIPEGSRGKWLEDLFRRESGLKQARDLIQLASKSRRHDIADTLRDYARVLSKGHELSDRQKKMVDSMRQQISNDQPDRDLIERDRHLLRGLHNVKRSNATYWLNRPIVSKRLDKIFKRFYVDGAIAPRDWNYVRTNFRSRTEAFDNFSTRHPVGSLRWTVRSGNSREDRWLPVVVISECRFASSGHLVTDVMFQGDFKVIDVETLRINKPK